jgi:hypothetical protein
LPAAFSSAVNALLPLNFPTGHRVHADDPTLVAYRPGAQRILLPSVHLWPDGQFTHEATASTIRQYVPAAHEDAVVVAGGAVVVTADLSTHAHRHSAVQCCPDESLEFHAAPTEFAAVKHPGGLIAELCCTGFLFGARPRAALHAARLSIASSAREAHVPLSTSVTPAASDNGAGVGAAVVV